VIGPRGPIPCYGPMANFPKSARLRRTPEFRSTFDLGEKLVCGPLVLYAARRNKTSHMTPDSSQQEGSLRLGLVVSRKVGNSVVRNRVKRAIREAFRQTRAKLEATAPWNSIDLIVLARPSASTCSGAQLKERLESCLKRIEKSLIAKNTPKAGAPRHA
jgi:ribonuclease P protein component